MTLAAARAVPPSLTADQRRIVEWGDGPLVVIAGAGTGKTRVIVERVKWLLETKGAGTRDAEGNRIPAEPAPRDRDRPFDGPLTPEQILVLTYNVKAARELQDRLDHAVGPAARARMTVTNFHSFCQRILTESAADAGLPPHPDVLDGVAQVAPCPRQAHPPQARLPARQAGEGHAIVLQQAEVLSEGWAA